MNGRPETARSEAFAMGHGTNAAVGDQILPWNGEGPRQQKQAGPKSAAPGGAPVRAARSRRPTRKSRRIRRPSLRRGSLSATRHDPHRCFPKADTASQRYRLRRQDAQRHPPTLQDFIALRRGNRRPLLQVTGKLSKGGPVTGRFGASAPAGLRSLWQGRGQREWQRGGRWVDP